MLLPPAAALLAMRLLCQSRVPSRGGGPLHDALTYSKRCSSGGSVSLSVFLVSVAFVVCAVWLVALCGVCTWCQRKLGKRNKPWVEAASSPESVRGRGENKAINDLDRDFWNNNDSSNVQQRWSSYPPKEFLLNMSPYAPYGDPRLTPNFGDASLSSASTLEHIPSSAVARPRPLVRQQSLQQPLTHQPPPGPNDPPVTSQSLGQLHTGPGGGGHRGGPRGVRGSPAGASRHRGGGGAGRSRSNPGSWDHMMEQIRNRGLDVKSFFEGKMVVLSLAIGLAEQDDFANLPDLQEAPASQENETTPEKRLYIKMNDKAAPKSEAKCLDHHLVGGCSTGPKPSLLHVS
ncbi:unnamed protein product [Pleuronectes platessa]|uniref:Uncharacterized protein n=1 Tax=Pleuronectes platessa TaxID=8262 RepID=A0A9N7TX67_PLEPL|nr:unnamed protein product [Pleuronectes platessa]